MTSHTLPAILIALLTLPSLAWADSCGGPCPEPCPPLCPEKVECRKARKVECCERVKVCVPVEKVKSRLVKTVCRVPKTRTKCVSQGPCAPPRQVTWTTYRDKASYHWERYTVTEYKTRYRIRCTEQFNTTSPCPSNGTVVLASK